MALSSNIKVEPATWTDLYSEASIPVGNKVRLQAVFSTADVLLSDSQLRPTEATGYISMDGKKQYENGAGDLGLWAYSVKPASISIEEI